VESADSQFASAYLSFTSDVLQQNQITDYLVRVVQPRLSSISGVQRAEVLGARTFAMRIWLKPERMAAYNISPAQVRQALAANNFLAAVGQTKGALVQVNLTANTDLRSVPEFKRLVIREQGGAIVRLEDIAEVVLGAEDYDTEVRFSGQTAVFMGIWALPNANSIDVIGRVRVEMEAIQSQLPTGLQARIAYDATNYITNAIHEVLRTLGDTLVIVVVVIFLFLGSFRSVLIPVVAIPLSLIGAVFLMQVFGFTLNLLTLLVGAEAPGLEIRERSGHWLAVTAVPGVIVCNVGDMLQRMTLRVLRSTTHRVVNPPPPWSERSRYSLPFFLHLRSSVPLTAFFMSDRINSIFGLVQPAAEPPQ